MPTPEQQQDHAELAEDVERLVGPDEAENGRPDDDTGDDLADDGGHVDPLRDLGGQLRRDEHDEDVEEDGTDVHECGASADAGSVDVLEDVAASPHRADLKT